MNSDKNHFSFSKEELDSFLRIGGVICLGILALFLLVKTVNEVKTYPTIGEETATQNIISVNGESEMFIQPDITTFSWTVDASGKTVEEAQSKAAEKGNKAIAFLKEKGIAEADIKTTSYYTNTKYEDRNTPCPVSAPISPRPSSAPSAASMPAADSVTYVMPCGSKSVEVGFDTSQTVQVKVRDIQNKPSLTSELITGLGTIGVKASSPYSTVEKPEVFKQKVRAEAIAKARVEAESLARSLGVKLVKVVNFNENGNGYPSPYYYERDAAAGMAVTQAAKAPELPTGTNKITSTVTVTYQIR